MRAYPHTYAPAHVKTDADLEYAMQRIMYPLHRLTRAVLPQMLERKRGNATAQTYVDNITYWPMEYRETAEFREPVRRFVDERGQLRPDPFRQTGRAGRQRFMRCGHDVPCGPNSQPAPHVTSSIDRLGQSLCCSLISSTYASWQSEAALCCAASSGIKSLTSNGGASCNSYDDDLASRRIMVVYPSSIRRGKP
jgi:hypothetical protein